MAFTQTLMIAHRGESFDAPENTLAAFDLAWQRGISAIELDVHLTADGHVVVCHDRSTQRTAGTNFVIAETPLQVLQTVDVGALKSPRYAGQRLPTLDEVLGRAPGGSRVFVEIKSSVEAVEPVASIVERFSQVVVSVIAFNREVVRAAKHRLPGTQVLWLVSPRRDDTSGHWQPTTLQMIDTAMGIGDGLNVDARSPIDGELVDRARSAGMAFYVWTVDEPARARELAALGVDGITSNRAAYLREQLSL